MISLLIASNVVTVVVAAISLLSWREADRQRALAEEAARVASDALARFLYDDLDDDEWEPEWESRNDPSTRPGREA